MAIGWDTTTLARELGRGDRLGSLLYGGRRMVNRRTAERVAALYDRLWDTPGPSTIGRAAASRAGYLPPLAWDDDTIDDPAAGPGAQLDVHADPIAVELACNGNRDVRLTGIERRLAVRRLRDEHCTYRDIAARLGIAERQVCRDLDHRTSPRLEGISA